MTPDHEQETDVLNLRASAIFVGATEDDRQVVITLGTDPPVEWELAPEIAIEVARELKATALRIQVSNG